MSEKKTLELYYYQGDEYIIISNSLPVLLNYERVGRALDAKIFMVIPDQVTLLGIAPPEKHQVVRISLTVESVEVGSFAILFQPLRPIEEVS